MAPLWEFVLRHGYALLFAAVLVEQAGAPVPAAPVMVVMGALAGLGHYSLASAFFVALSAALAADLMWFETGRRRGAVVLNFLCRIALEPDSCVKRTHHVWDRWGARTLLLAKFLPGVNVGALR